VTDLDDPRTWRPLGSVHPDGHYTYKIRSIMPAPAGSVSVFLFDQGVDLVPVKYLALCDVANIVTRGSSRSVRDVVREVLSFSFSADSDDPDSAFEDTFLALAPSEAIGRAWGKEAMARRAKTAAALADRKAATP